MIFIPKIKFYRESLSGSTKKKVKISGFENDATFAPPPGAAVASLPDPFNYDGSDNEANLSGYEHGTRDSLSEGERILTLKTPQELAKEVEALKYVLKMKQRRIDEQADEIAKLLSETKHTESQSFVASVPSLREASSKEELLMSDSSRRNMLDSGDKLSDNGGNQSIAGDTE